MKTLTLCERVCVPRFATHQGPKQTFYYWPRIRAQGVTWVNRSWKMHYVYGSPHKDRSNRICVSHPVGQHLICWTVLGWCFNSTHFLDHLSTQTCNTHMNTTYSHFEYLIYSSEYYYKCSGSGWNETKNNCFQICLHFFFFFELLFFGLWLFRGCQWMNYPDGIKQMTSVCLNFGLKNQKNFLKNSSQKCWIKTAKTIRIVRHTLLHSSACWKLLYPSTSVSEPSRTSFSWCWTFLLHLDL